MLGRAAVLIWYLGFSKKATPAPGFILIFFKYQNLDAIIFPTIDSSQLIIKHLKMTASLVNLNEKFQIEGTEAILGLSNKGVEQINIQK